MSQDELYLWALGNPRQVPDFQALVQCHRDAASLAGVP